VANHVFEIKPHIGLGNILFGSSRESVHEILGNPESSQEPHQQSDLHFPCKDFYFESCLQIVFDKNEKVEFIESSLDDNFKIMFLGKEVLKLREAELLSLLKDHYVLNENDSQYPYVFSYPEIDLSFWRESVPQILREEMEMAESDEYRDFYLEDIERYAYFETVGFGRKGYYST